MIKVGFLALALAAAGLTGCGDGGTGGQSGGASASNSGPNRTEAKVEKAQLEAFAVFFPAEANGWKKQDQLGAYTSDSASTITATYRKADGGPTLALVVTFSNMIVGQTEGLIADPKQAGTYGFEATTFAGYPALSGKQPGPTAGTAWTVVVSNSRQVQAMISPADGATRDEIKAVFEKVDFKGIADK